MSEHDDDCIRPVNHGGTCAHVLSLHDDGEVEALARDFYICPNTGEWVYKWCDERLTLDVPDADDGMSRRERAERRIGELETAVSWFLDRQPLDGGDADQRADVLRTVLRGEVPA